MKNKKKNRIYLLIMLLLGITIGFASLATTLKINGTANINKNTWNIYWDPESVSVADGSKGSTIPLVSNGEDGSINTKVTWTVNLDVPGDFYEFDVIAVNAGTIDAEITSIVHTLNGETMSTTNKLPDYIKYSVKYQDGSDISVGDVLRKRRDTATFTRRTYKVKVEYDKDAVTVEDVNNMVSTGLSYEIGFSVTYGQHTIPSAVSFATDSWETIAFEGSDAAKQTSTTGSCGPYDVGDTKEVDLGDLGIHTVRIANCSTPVECSGSDFSQTACGFVLEFTDIITARTLNLYSQNATVNGDGNKGSWEYSDGRAFLNNTIYTYGDADYTETGVLSKLPNTLKDKIASTKVVTGFGGTDNAHGIFETSDKLYLLSPHEILEDMDNNQNSGLNTVDRAYDYTRQLDYYKIHEVSTIGNTSYSIKKSNGTNSFWWTRTPYYPRSYSYIDCFTVIRDSGSFSEAGVWGAAGISPAFKIENN